MIPRLRSDRNDLGRSLPPDLVPEPSGAIGLHEMRAVDREVWEEALPYLNHRDNDVHTIYAYGLARALLDEHPEADPDVVLPAIILHDTGWSQVPLDEIMAALAPGAWSGAASLATVRKHEVHGARIAREILTSLGRPAEVITTIEEMIDGHDTRPTALSLDDALLKDADRLWRVTPRGIDVVMDWFGIDRDASLRINSSRVHGHLFTDAGRTMARALSAVGWVDTSPQRRALD